MKISMRLIAVVAATCTTRSLICAETPQSLGGRPKGDPAFGDLHSKAGHPMAVIDEQEYKQYINSFAVSQMGTWLISVTSGDWNDLTYGYLHEQEGRFFHFYNAMWDRIQISEIDPQLFLPPGETPSGERRAELAN